MGLIRGNRKNVLATITAESFGECDQSEFPLLAVGTGVGLREIDLMTRGTAQEEQHIFSSTEVAQSESKESEESDRQAWTVQPISL